jgi:hypothetical protein
VYALFGPPLTNRNFKIKKIIKRELKSSRQMKEGREGEKK